MVETVLTPAHPDPFEALLDEPFTGTFDHPRAQRQPQCLVRGIVDVLAVPIQIRIHRASRCPAPSAGNPSTSKASARSARTPSGMAMPQAVPCPAKPPAGLGGPPIQPGRRPLPQVLRRVVKVQDPRGIGREALLKQAPQPPAAITEPDHLGRLRDALAHALRATAAA